MGVAVAVPHDDKLIGHPFHAPSPPQRTSKAQSGKGRSRKVFPANKERSSHIVSSDSYTSCESSSCESSSCESDYSRARRNYNGKKQQQQQQDVSHQNWPKNNGKNKKKNNKAFKSGGTKRDKKRSNRNNQTKNLVTPEEQKQYLALDCEMVGVGCDGRQSMVARVTVIDWDCNVVYDKFVKPTQEVTDYRTFVSGITADDLDEQRNTSNLLDINTCREQVLELLHDKILIGHALKNDLHVLDITHPWYQIRDTAKYEPFMKVRFDDGILWPRKLKELVNEKLHYDIQIPGKPHNSYEDAAAALHLYRCVRNKWEKAMTYKIKKTKEIQQKQAHANQ